jgi:hypothetical protein
MLILNIRTDAIKNLALLQGCLALEVLALKDYYGSINLEATENDVFLDLVQWLQKCEQLRELYLNNFVSAPSTLTNVCLNNNTRLRKLEVVGSNYTLTNNHEFHRALSHQTSLESLRLTADPEGAFGDDIEILISSVCQLTKLTYLDLSGTSYYFRSAQIRLIATSLKGLETFKFGGYDMTDDVLHSFIGFVFFLPYFLLHIVIMFNWTT